MCQKWQLQRLASMPVWYPAFSKMSPACYGAVFDELEIIRFDGGVANYWSRRIPRRWQLFASAFFFAVGRLKEVLAEVW